MLEVRKSAPRQSRLRDVTSSHERAGLRSMDAMHLASARLANVGEIFTYENATRRKAWHGLTQLPLSEPTVARAQLDFGSEP